MLTEEMEYKLSFGVPEENVVYDFPVDVKELYNIIYRHEDNNYWLGEEYDDIQMAIPSRARLTQSIGEFQIDIDGVFIELRRHFKHIHICTCMVGAYL